MLSENSRCKERARSPETTVSEHCPHRCLVSWVASVTLSRKHGLVTLVPDSSEGNLVPFAITQACMVANLRATPWFSVKSTTLGRTWVKVSWGAFVTPGDTLRHVASRLALSSLVDPFFGPAPVPLLVHHTVVFRFVTLSGLVGTAHGLCSFSAICSCGVCAKKCHHSLPAHLQPLHISPKCPPRWCHFTWNTCEF